MNATETKNQVNSKLEKAAEKLNMERRLEGILAYIVPRDTQLTDVFDFLKAFGEYKKVYNGGSFKTYEKEFASTMPCVADECFRGANPIIGVGVIRYVWEEIKKAPFEKDILEDIKKYLNKRIEETRI